MMFKRLRRANTAKLMFLTGCRTEMHIWKYGWEYFFDYVRLATLHTWKKNPLRVCHKESDGIGSGICSQNCQDYSFTVLDTFPALITTSQIH